MCNLHVVGHMFAWLHISLFLTGNNFMELHKREWRSLSRHFYILYSLPPPLDGSYMFQKERSYLHFFAFLFLYNFLWWVRLCWPLLCLCPPFYIFERCLDSNPESCPRNQARYQLSHPPNLAIHFCLSFYVTWKDHNISFPVDRSFFLEHGQILCF